MYRFSTVFKMARDNGWVNGDPFKLQKLHLDKVDRSYLNQQELETVMHKEFDTVRLEQIRDVFVFCCFTGLPYIDAQKLNESHLKTWADGSQWLTLHRQKTKVPVNVKLLPIALDILDKYKDTVEDRGGRLLPVPTNQKCNEYLKEIATLCGIKKEVTFHGLRHSFATRCIESKCDYKTVSVLLGHSNISTTLNLYVHPNMEQKKKCVEQMFKTLR